MRITKITTRIIEFDPTPRYSGKPIPKGRPLTWKFPLVTLHTNEGLEGYATGYGPHGDGQALGEITHHVYSQELLGEDPMRSEHLWQKLTAKNRHLYNLSEAASGVLDVALWDLKGKICGKSVAELLGLYRDRVKAYASSHLFMPTEEEIYEEVRTMKGRGFHGFKLQLRDGLHVDIPRFEAAREAAGASFPLMQDAVSGYSYSEAVTVGKVLERLGYVWFEEPIADRNLSLLKKLSEQISVPVLAGETITLAEMAHYLSFGGFSMIRGDTLIKGGITGLHKAFHLCELQGVNLEIHTAGTTLMDVANLHVACAHRNCEYMESHHPIFRFGLKNSPLEIDKKGYLHLPQKPGLGVELDWDWLENHTSKVFTDSLP